MNLTELTIAEWDLLVQELSKNPRFLDNRDEFENRSAENEDSERWANENAEQRLLDN